MKRGNWNMWVSTIISIIALTVTVWGFIRQLQFESNYNDNVRQVMINSIDLAIGDMDRLDSRLDDLNGELVNVSSENLAIEQNSLEENLNVIKQVEATNIPKEQELNYQFYRQELNRCVISIKDGIMFAKNSSDSLSTKDKKKYHVKSGWIHVDEISKQVIKYNIKSEKEALKDIRKTLTDHKNISNERIRKANDLVEKGQLQ